MKKKRFFSCFLSAFDSSPYISKDSILLVYQRLSWLIGFTFLLGEPQTFKIHQGRYYPLWAYSNWRNNNDTALSSHLPKPRARPNPKYRAAAQCCSSGIDCAIGRGKWQHRTLHLFIRTARPKIPITDDFCLLFLGFKIPGPHLRGRCTSLSLALCAVGFT